MAINVIKDSIIKNEYSFILPTEELIKYIRKIDNLKLNSEFWISDLKIMKSSNVDWDGIASDILGYWNVSFSTYTLSVQDDIENSIKLYQEEINDYILEVLPDSIKINNRD